MVLPITGPITDNFASGPHQNVGSVRIERQRWRQTRPYDRPMPYRGYFRTVMSGGGRDPSNDPLENWWLSTGFSNTGRVNGVPDSDSSSWSDLASTCSRTLNKAREKFFAKCNTRVSLSVDLLQRKQALSMMTARVAQVGSILSNIRRGKVREALAALGIKKPAGWRPATRNAGGLWLEYSYGWKPLVQDIFDAASVLSSRVDDLWVHESTSNPFAVENIESNVGSVVDANVVDTCSVDLKVYARVGAVVSCDNPNLHTLANAGLTNPLAWAWELIPWSSVVDWLWNVSDFINQLDDSVGLTITNGFSTVGYKGSSRISRLVVKAWPLHMPMPQDGSDAWKSFSVAKMTRETGIPLVKLVRRAKVLTSLPRALNAASLLAQQLR